MGDILFRELTKVVNLYYNVNPNIYRFRRKDMKQCAICKTQIDKDEHLCSKCRREQVMDQERETYIDLLGGRK